MIEHLLLPFQYDYMLRAMLVSGFVAGVCGLLSCFVTLKGWSLMGDALSHAVVPGVALAYLLSWPFAVGAFFAGILATFGMGLIRRRSNLKEDAVIGIVFTIFFAMGVLMISLAPAGLSLKTIVFGNILSITNADLLQVVLVSAVVLVVLGIWWRDLVAVSFDPQQSSAMGFSTSGLNFLLLVLLAGMAVAAMQAVGAVLVVATLITPGATAYLLTDRFARMMGIALGVGVGSGFLGAYGSYFVDGATGGCIVVLQTLCFLAALVFAPKHGMLRARANRDLAGRKGAW